MYCRKCGKEIFYDAPICKECEEAELFFNFNEQPINFQQEPVGDRKEGFGKALTATILGVIAVFISAIAFGVVTALIEQYTANYYYDTTAIGSIVAVGVVFSLIAVGLSIPSLILGIKSIKVFKLAVNEGRVKPIATLVLGIVGVATSALAFLYVLLSLSLCALI